MSAVPKFKIGDRVVKNPDCWRSSEFDEWGCGEGVGIIVEPPFTMDDGEVDVMWPAGRAFCTEDQLLHADKSDIRAPVF